MKKYMALARVSSREQEQEGFSLEVQEDGLFWAMAIGLIFDIVVIPWLYVVHNFVKAKGNPWGRSA